MAHAALFLLLLPALACSSPAAPAPASTNGGAPPQGGAPTSGAPGQVGGAGTSSSASGSGGTSGGGGGQIAGATSGGAGSASVGGAGAAGTAGGAPVDPKVAQFSFFLTSLSSIRMVSGSDQGFGGDLRFGEVGDGAGLRGADKICKAIAEIGMAGAGAKDWRAFLSTTAGAPGGGPVHAKSRIGNGPWYDATGRLVSMTLAALIGGNRPGGADPAIRDDLPNEFGIPNHTAEAPGCSGGECPDNHQVLTGTNCVGELYTGGGSGSGQNEITPTCEGITPPSNAPNPAYTCNDWTSKAAEGDPWCGHSWPRQGSGLSWMSAAKDGGCAPCVRIEENGGVSENCVGSAGGYGGFYCFEYRP
ncbi:MAG TPA: hypothetical protein VIW29_07660 [Polyangiaceae bacterium]